MRAKIQWISIGVLILFVLVLAGCTQRNAECTAPYIAKGAECCLDRNENNICDEDETSKVTAVVKDRPVVMYEEVCDATSRFECLEKKITNDYVWLKLRFNKDEVLKVKKVALPELGCSQEFTNEPMKYNDVQEFTIPCLLGGKEIVKSKLIIDADVQNYLRYSNGQVYELTQPRTFSFSGVVSGFVQP